MKKIIILMSILCILLFVALLLYWQFANQYYYYACQGKFCDHSFFIANVPLDSNKPMPSINLIMDDAESYKERYIGCIKKSIAAVQVQISESGINGCDELFERCHFMLKEHHSVVCAVYQYCKPGLVLSKKVDCSGFSP